jgi:hypothetical protein
VSKSRGDDFWQMLMLGNGEHLLFCEAAHAYAIFERDHVTIPNEQSRLCAFLLPVSRVLRRKSPRWSVEETDACFITNGQQVAYVFE